MRPARTFRVVRAAFTALVLVAAPLTAAPSALANHGGRTLQVRPESASVPLDGTHVMTAVLSRAAGVTSGAVNVDFENEAGVNDIDGHTPESPDLTCTVVADETSCTVSYSGSATGRDVWRAWIDHDGQDSTIEADPTEGRNEDRLPGGGGTICNGAADDGEPDCTDVVEVLWGTGSLDCDDAQGPDTERNTNPSGGGSVSNEVYTCALTDALGRADTGVQVQAEVLNGINDPDEADGASFDSPDYTCTTSSGTQANPAGSCTITVTQNENEAGSADVCFWTGNAEAGTAACADEPIDENQEADGGDAGNDLADAVQKTWEERSAVGGGIDAEPETATSGFGSHSITVTVYDQFGQPFNGNTTVFAEFFRGSPSDDDRNTPASADLSCTTVNASSCTLTYSQATVPGTDLLCVWTATAPVMAGTNNNGTCDTEPLTEADDTPGSADAPEPEGDDVDVVQRVWQNATPATVVDCAPEAQKARRNTSPAITCTATDAAGIPIAGAEIDAEAIGVNDPDAADAPTPPDFSCVTGAEGRCSFLHGPRGVGATNAAGTTLYRAWIDADNDNATSEGDTSEGLNETTTAGGAEPDDTDVVSITWTAIRCDIAGTPGPDRLVGNSRGQTICGLGGNDRILAGGGNDRILGDRGNDVIDGHGGGDRIEGGSGNDTLRGNDGSDSIQGGSGRDSLAGGPGRDRCNGGPGRDSVSGCEG